MKPEVLKSANPQSGTSVDLGQTIAYEVEYINTDNAAQKVIITDAVPQHTVLVDGSAECEEGASCSAGEIDLGLVRQGRGIVCATWDDVAPGESVRLRFEARVDDDAAGQLIENKADIAVNDGQIVLSTNKTEHEVVAPGEDPANPADPDDPIDTAAASPGASAKGYAPKTGDAGIALIGLLLACVGGGIALLLKAMAKRRRI